jgi:hypothetical protein
VTILVSERRAPTRRRAQGTSLRQRTDLFRRGSGTR